MRQFIIAFLISTCLFVAAKPVDSGQFDSNSRSLIIKQFHATVLGNDLNYYYVTIDFNLSTQSFTGASAHKVTVPGTEYGVTINSGAGTSIPSSGVSCLITSTVNMTAANNATFSLPEETSYTFD